MGETQEALISYTAECEQAQTWEMEKLASMPSKGYNETFFKPIHTFIWQNVSECSGPAPCYAVPDQEAWEKGHHTSLWPRVIPGRWVWEISQEGKGLIVSRLPP